MGLGTGNQSINIVTDLSQLKTWLIKWLANKKLEKVPKWLDNKMEKLQKVTSSEEDCPKISKSQVRDMMTSKDKNKQLPPSLSVTKGVNTFGSFLFNDLEKSENLVFSPFSLSTALAMLTPAAKGKTLEQVKILFKIRDHPFKKALITTQNTCTRDTRVSKKSFSDNRITLIALSFDGHHDRIQVNITNSKVKHICVSLYHI